jgi:alkylhydroperoxidase family enzyme
MAMSEFSYADAPVAVRADLPEAHRRAWRRLAAPGTWWTGEERVAIAAEARNAARCGLCRRRKAALSPHAEEGEHDGLGALPDAAVDVIHRVVTDPGRLSRAWFEKTLASGLSDAQYVEIIGVVVTVVSIDSFCRGLGVPSQPLPGPEPGEPSRRRPPAAGPDGAWVAMIPQGRSAGPDADLLGAGRTPNVMRAMSLVPEEARGLLDLGAAHYLSTERMMDLRAGRALDRAQMELIAGRVSALNECFY